MNKNMNNIRIIQMDMNIFHSNRSPTHNDLVDKVQPGDRVTVTGIYRAFSLRVNPMVSNVKSVYRTHIDVVHYRKVDIHRLRNETERGYVLFWFWPSKLK